MVAARAAARELKAQTLVAEGKDKKRREAAAINEKIQAIAKRPKSAGINEDVLD